MENNIKNIAKQNMDTWLETLLTKDPKQVAKMYSEDNTFLPTVSGDFKKGKSGAEDYFVHFLAKNPVGKVTEDELNQISDEAYLHVGMYTFELGAEDNRQEASARFTYLWKKNEAGEWKIEHHHSSLRP